MADREGDKYEVLEKIGQGSFGVINKVRRKSDGHILCRKEISYGRMSQKEREQLSAEIQILRELRHPNIVAYYSRSHDRDTEDVHLYMEYCGNGDLGRTIDNLKSEGKYADEEFVWSMFSQIVSALYRCHYGEDPPEVGRVGNVLQGGRRISPPTKTARMILHRDLKPQNIFLGEDSSVKLGDFGLSKIIASHDFASTYVGTPFYMSPEICAAERYTLHSDIWSLGCIMYELCMTEPPFTAKTHFDLIQKIKIGRTSPLPAIYSSELRNVIASCLRVDPSKRPDTAQLINLPVVKLMRKEAEAVSLGQQLRTEKERCARKTREAEERMRHMDSKMKEARKAIDDNLRLQWEVRARLEIQKQVQEHVDHLNAVFEAEVQKRIAAEVSSALEEAHKSYVVSRTPPRSRVPSSASNASTGVDGEAPVNATKSCSTSGEASEFPSQTDLSEFSDLALDSPLVSKKGFRPSMSGSEFGRHPSRTPFTRAKTSMDPAVLQSPVDVHMTDPSPVAVSALNLSPRRTQPGAQPKFTSAPDTNAMAAGKTIFAAAAATAKWEPTNASTLPNLSDVEDSDANVTEDEVDRSEVDNIPVLPSPTRRPSNNVDPFKSLPTSKPSRPSLGAAGRTKTMPSALHRVTGQQRLATTPNLFAAVQTSQHPSAHSSATAKSRPSSTVPVVATSPSRNRPASPSRNSPRKAPATSASAGNTVGLQSKKGRYEEVTRQAQRSNNTVTGRTLVELAQARAGGRDIVVGEADAAAPKGRTHMRRATELKEPARWDPESDDMPSPFLRKTAKIVR